MSRARDALGFWLVSLGFASEVPFTGLSGKRRFRWDWAHERRRVAVEWQGIGVGHQSIRGTFRDHEKVTEGQLCGWTVILCNVESERDGRCRNWIETAMERPA